jgi:hypothetical protein
MTRSNMNTENSIMTTKKKGTKPMKKDQHTIVGECLNGTTPSVSSPDSQALKMNLQLFAGEVDFSELVEKVTDGDSKRLLFPFTEDEEATAGETDSDVDETDDTEEEIIPDDPILFPRLVLTDKNFLHTSVGETVIRNIDGELSTVTVSDDGTVAESSFQLGADNIEEGCITGSKLEEGTITSRELDMAEIFADATLLNQTLAENLDTDGMFNNEHFLTHLDERIAEKAVLNVGDTMTGPLTLPGNPADQNHAATKQYVDTLSPLRFRVTDA